MMFPSAETKTFGMEQKHDATRTNKDISSIPLATSYAMIGTARGAVQHPATITTTNVLGAATRIMELRVALELRRGQALSPYNAEALTRIEECLSMGPVTIKLSW